MEESGGEDREGRDEISLLANELIQLTVKGSKMKSIWKTKKKFEIQRVGQNLFLIVFELEEDLESILEGRPWLFQFDKKDLMHAIGVTFGGLSDLKLAILAAGSELVWMFENHYVENLPIFCFGCGRMGHGITDCTQIIPARKSKISSDPPYSLALKAESKLVGKESMKFNAMWRNVGVQSTYTGGKVVLTESCKVLDKEKNEIKEIQENMELMGGKELMQQQEIKFGLEEVKKIDSSKAQMCKDINHEKKKSWKRIKPVVMELESVAKNSIRKRKFSEGGGLRSDEGDGIKRLKLADVEGCDRAFSEGMLDSSEQTEVQNLLRSAAANRQADRTQ
ncbi:hypothetical protein Gotri_025480 [Gossypium trilobum]|uniref:CCHC-type domain-containing protein n=1 Tax=Gossypium trilobum TaxID=34281 RepID=A0A7J9FJC2_9ROSI|nr:hypothetical protein [Gossypium trilobum]